jgi:hypothetical protein
MTQELKPRCCERVQGSGYNSSQCSKNAKVERDGRHYCGIHDPVAVKAKNDKRHADWKLKHHAKKLSQKEARAKRDEIERRAGCFDDLLNALKESQALIIRMAEGKEWGAIEEYIQENGAAIDKAKGEQA